jgi:isoleucyl-tRNA synthetase
VIKAVKAGEWTRHGDTVTAGGIELREGEYSLRLVVDGDGASTPLGGASGVVVLDTELTPELAAEGTARDLIRLVQQARRDAKLHVSDRIVLTLGVPEPVRRQLAGYAQLVADATLATSVNWVDGEPNAELDGVPVHISVARV